MWCVVVCDLENLVNEEALAHWRLSRNIYIYIFFRPLTQYTGYLSEWRKSVTATANNNVEPESKYLNARRNEDSADSSSDQSQLMRQ